MHTPSMPPPPPPSIFFYFCCSAEYRAKLKVVPQRTLNSYPPGLLGPEGWWARGDLVLHFPGTKGGDYARAIELPQPNVDGAFPACRSGDETGAWERWAQGPAVGDGKL